LSGCGSNVASESSQSADAAAITASTPAAADPDAAIAALAGRVFSVGPNGEQPQGIETTELTDAEVAEIKKGGYTAAISLHYGGNDWSTAQVAGLKQEFARLGIEVVAVTDANFKPDKQVSDVETIIAKKPDILVSLPTDPVATAGAYKKAEEAGIKVVFMDNVPQGQIGGKDYVAVVSADNKGAGIISGHQMAKALGGRGKVGLIHHEADFFVTKQMLEGFNEAIADYPGIEIVEDKGVAGPDFTGDAQTATTAILTKHPDLDAMWGVWDVPAEGIIAAARAAGRDDLIVTTLGLGANVATSMAKQEFVTGIGAVRPFDLGIAEARLGAAALIGKQGLPNFVAVEAIPVDRVNLADSWTKVYGTPVPSAITEALSK
jgi:ribose transport system substrate-binding protein